MGYGEKYRSEEAANLAKSIPEFKTDGFEVDNTGRTPISIDIYTIESDGVKIPVQLRYDPNQLKVDADASWVGFGWSLDVGGTIERTVNGAPDDLVSTARHLQGVAIPLRGYGISGGKKIFNYNWRMNLSTPDDKREIYKNLNNVTKSFENKIFRTNNPNPDVDFALRLKQGSIYDTATINNEGIDTEPDVFYYDLFNRGRGKFLFGYSSVDNKLTPRTIPYDNIEINMQVDDTTLYYNEDDIYGKENLHSSNPYTSNNNFWHTNGANSFVIKDDNGTQYNFTTPDVTNTRGMSWPAYNIGCDFASLTHNKQQYEDLVVQYRNSWHINQVTTANGRPVNFSYQPEHIYHINLSRKTANQDLYNIATTGIPERFHEINYTKTVIVNNKIKTIETDHERIDFILSTGNRLDVPSSKSLDKIIIYEKSGSNYLEKMTITFNYDYYTTNNDEILSYDNFNANKRLKLTGIQFSNNGVTVPPYTFTYDESRPIPKKHSVKKDLYGYYNNSTTYIKYLYPRLYVYPNKYGVDRYTIHRRWDWYNAGETEYTLEGLDRNTNQYATVGALKRITIPLNGFIEYEFEPNSYYWFGTNLFGGGIRVKSINTNSGLPNAQNITRNYSYYLSNDNARSSGRLLVAPILAYGENHCGIESPDYVTGLCQTCGNPPSNFARNSLAYIRQFTWRLEEPVFNRLTDAGDPLVVYSEIIESIQDRGKTATTYWVPRDANSSLISPDYQNLNTGLESINQTQPLTRIINGNGFWSNYYGSLLSHDMPVVLNVSTALDLAGVDYSNDSYFSAAKLNLGWTTGMPIDRKYFNTAGVLQKEDKYSYQMVSGGNVGPVYIPALKQGSTRVYNTASYTETQPTKMYNSALGTSHIYYAHYYQLANVKMLLKSSETIDHSSGHPLATTIKYNYFSDNNFTNLDFYPRSITTINSNGDELVQKFKYVRDYTLNPQQPLNALNGLPGLIAANKYSTLIEEWTAIKRNGAVTPFLQQAILKEYNSFPNAPDAGALLKKVYTLYPASASITNFTPSNVSANAFTKDSRYQEELVVDKVDPIGNVLQRSQPRGSRIVTQLMGYDTKKTIATIDNAQFGEIAYSSFEEGAYPALGTIEESKGNWLFDADYIANDPTAPSGSRFYNLQSELSALPSAVNSFVESSFTIPSGKKYYLTFWMKDRPGTTTLNVYNGTMLQQQPAPILKANGWSCYQYPITGSGNLVKISLSQPTATGTIHNERIDELRLLPIAASINSCAYDKVFNTPLTIIDEGNKITRYEYDHFGRLTAVKDAKGNLIKQSDYKYQSPE